MKYGFVCIVATRGLLIGISWIVGLSLVSPLFSDSELNIPGHRLVWNDEFEGDAVDSSKWDVNVGVNAWYIRASDGRFIEPHWFNEEVEPWTDAGTIGNERQYYSPDQVTVDQGILEIRSERKSIEDPVGIYDPNFHVYKSGKMNTADEFQFTFGIVKMRGQVPAGQGMWPAFWMLNEPEPYWYWDDEIDIMEARGSQPTVATSAHHYKVVDNEGNRENFFNVGYLETGVNLSEDFHEYSLEWTQTSIQTWIDGQEVLYDEIRIPQGPMFLIMNAAVGGDFDGIPASDDIFPAFFRVDWVRVWQPASTPTDLASGGFEEVQGAQWANWNTLDDGNLSSVSSEPLHGSWSVQIDRSDVVPTDGTRGPDLLSGGTAGIWSGFLNRFSGENAYLGGEVVDPSTIPATASGDEITLSIPQVASSPIASGILFREFSGPDLQGRTLNYTGSVVIEEAFAQGNEATAFIRIFNPDFSFTEVVTSVLEGGEFNLQARIPASGISMVQIGLEAKGPTGSAGRLAASGLYLEEEGTGASGEDPKASFIQTVAASPGKTVRYGLLAANHPIDPIGTGAEGHLVLEFLDAGESVIGTSSTVIMDADSPAQATPHVFEIETPANAVWARLTIERFTTDPETDLSGSFLADAVFLHDINDTELPVFTEVPESVQTVNAWAPVELSVETSSPTSVDYNWYLNGELISTQKDYTFFADKTSEGTYFAIADNSAGPVIGALLELSVETDFPDADGDLLSDQDELNVYGTDPSKPDSDSDGISDYNEIFLSFTDPLDPASKLAITKVEIAENRIDLTFMTQPGVSYSVEGSANLTQWEAIGTPLQATETVSSVSINRADSSSPLRFFRVIPTR